LNGKNDLVETAIDSVADARPAIQIVRNPHQYSRPCKYIYEPAARDAAIIFVLARHCESGADFLAGYPGSPSLS
jgi:hypothetical protein